MDDIIGSDGLDSLLPSAWCEGYEVLAILKNSPHRTTALVKRKSDGAKLVLKRSDSEQEDLSYELSILREVGGDGIPECLDFVSEDGVGYILREYIEGQSLLDYIQKRGALSKDETLSIMIPLCKIVKRLHSQTPPVIHRDIKAENIIRSSDGSVYLIDFGIARRYDEGSGQDTQVLGTPQYSPPEQYGYRQTDTRSDVYTMGALMHELLTGESALDKGTADSMLMKITDKCTHFPTRTEAALENPAKNPMISPSRVRKTAIAAMTDSGCRPKVTLMAILPIPTRISLQRMGKHLRKNSFRCTRSHRK